VIDEGGDGTFNFSRFSLSREDMAIYGSQKKKTYQLLVSQSIEIP
jgi:hypothetical protein